MDSYGQYCPLAKGAEVFAERWTPLILRELLRGSTTFNDLHRGVPRMSRTLLSRRLKKLEACGVIERHPGSRGIQYGLTRAGQEFGPVVTELGATPAVTGWGISSSALGHNAGSDPRSIGANWMSAYSCGTFDAPWTRTRYHPFAQLFNSYSPTCRPVPARGGS